MDNKSAFPGLDKNGFQTGMSLRGYYAGKAMQAMVGDAEIGRWVQGDPRYNENNFKEVIAMNAVEFADALIKELAK